MADFPFRKTNHLKYSESVKTRYAYLWASSDRILWLFSEPMALVQKERSTFLFFILRFDLLSYFRL